MRDAKLSEKEESGFKRGERYVTVSGFAFMKMETSTFFLR